MSSQSLVQIKLMANEFMQEYEREQAEREFQKQRLKQNIMIQIMSNRHKSQASRAIPSEPPAPDDSLPHHNSRAISSNLSLPPPFQKGREKEQISCSRVGSLQADTQEGPRESQNMGIGAEVTFKVPKNKETYILVQANSQNQKYEDEQNKCHPDGLYPSNTFQSKEDIDFNSTIKNSFQGEDRSPSMLEDQNPQLAQLGPDRKFRLAQPEIEPESQQFEQTVEEVMPQAGRKEAKGAFLTMEEEESVEETQELYRKNCAFDVFMEKSEPIENMEELRRRKIEAIEKQRQQRMEGFRKKEEQKKLDTSLSKVRNNSKKSQTKPSATKISEDPEPQARAVSGRNVPEGEDRDCRKGIVPRDGAMQESQYSVRAPRNNNSRPDQVVQTPISYQTPNTVISEARTKSRGGKNTIFRQSPRRAEKSASKYSQEPRIEPKDRKNSFAKQSNKKLMINAVTNACLPGELNRKEREKYLEVLEREGSQFLVFLFKEYSRKVIKAIYTLDQSQTCLQRVFGEKAPLEIYSEQVKNFYRFDSASKEFKRLDGCKSFSFVVHAIDLR